MSAKPVLPRAEVVHNLKIMRSWLITNFFASEKEGYQWPDALELAIDMLENEAPQKEIDLSDFQIRPGDSIYCPECDGQGFIIGKAGDCGLCKGNGHIPYVLDELPGEDYGH